MNSGNVNDKGGNDTAQSSPLSSKIKTAGLIGLGAIAGVLLSLNFSAVAEKPSTTLNLPIDEVRMLSEVFGRIKSDYVESVEDKRLIKEAINGMLTGLDPHSAFLDEDGFKEMQTLTTGTFGGLGIEVGIEEGWVKVISPIDDTPAARAGVKAGDFITKVDGVSIRGFTINEAVKKMRGEAGTDVVLTVQRRGESGELNFALRRAKIEIQSVRARTLEPGYAVIRLSSFEEATGEKLVRAANDLYKQNGGNLKGLVLDLRNDPGGLLNAAVAVSAAFLPKDSLVVYTDGRVRDAKMRLNARKEDYVRGSREDFLSKLPVAIKQVPLIVLVNNGTASASEIVAGALQDHKRASVMGTQTFGKGSVQTVLPLAGNKTAIKLTTARYYTPNGRAIQAKGIEPDIAVDDGFNFPATREADLDKHLAGEDEKKNAAALKAKLDAKLAEPEKTPATRPGAAPPGQAVEVAKSAREGDKTEMRVEYTPLTGADGKPIDFVLQQALNQLKGLPVAANPRALMTATANAAKGINTAAAKAAERSK